jgi:prepilin-type N-terminal cleavage/methylation domain-containing protein
MKKHKNLNLKKGFTLIEMLVSLSIFSLVLIVALSAVITIMDLNRKAQTLSSSVNNLNLAVESIVRTIKTADPSTIDTGSGSSCSNEISMITDSGKEVTYLVDSDNVLYKKIDSNLQQPIVGYEIVINKVCFQAENTLQPLVRIILGGEAKAGHNTSTEFYLQTTVSPIKLNI